MANDSELRNLARIKAQTDERLYQRVDFGLRMARLIYVVLAATVVAAIWLAGLQWRVNQIQQEQSARQILIDQHRRLWFLYEEGINNADAFRRRHGRSPDPVQPHNTN